MVQKIFAGTRGLAVTTHQLTFVATLCRDSEILTPAEQLQRLSASTRRFEALRRTGLHLYDDNRLPYHHEAGEGAVMAQHDKIKRDPRVQGFAILCQRKCGARLFPRWNFALAGDPRNGGKTTLVERVATLVSGIPAEITETFLVFAKLQIRAAAARR